MFQLLLIQVEGPPAVKKKLAVGAFSDYVTGLTRSYMWPKITQTAGIFSLFESFLVASAPSGSSMLREITFVGAIRRRDFEPFG